MKKIVTHKQIYKHNAFGGITNMTLCGRVNTYYSIKNNGTNVAEKFNCLFCKKTAKSKYGVEIIERSKKILDEELSKC